MRSRVLRFQCSVCDGQYASVKEWLDHLLESRHQDLAREGLVSWDVNMRKQALLVFSDQPVDEAGRILQYFSRDFLETLVTDFVWSQERPFLGFIRFESSKMARKAFSKVVNQNQEVWEDGQLFQLKKADKMTDLEWKALLPVSTRSASDTPEDVDNWDTQSVIECPVEPSPSAPIDCIDLDSDYEDEKIRRSRKKRKLNHQAPTESGDYLKRELELIEDVVKVTEEEYNSVLRLLSCLQQTISSCDRKYRKEGMTTEAMLSRNWLLKLKFNDNHPPFIWIQRKYKNTPGRFSCATIHNRMCGGKRVTVNFPSMSRIFPPPTESNHDLRKQPFVIYSLNTRNGNPLPNIKLSGEPHLSVEQHLWELIKYLCTFDSRCQSYLAVIYYWADLNSIQIAKFEETMAEEKKKGVSNIPDPFGITWLAMLFLCRKGIIPRPKMILRKPRTNNQSWFLTDNRFAEKTKEPQQFAKDIFTLVAQFFVSCGQTLREGEWMIDSKNGEIRKMSAVESNLEQAKDHRRLHFTNPFSRSSKIILSRSKKPYQAMVRTGERIEEFLQSYRNREEGDLLELLKI